MAKQPLLSSPGGATLVLRELRPEHGEPAKAVWSAAMRSYGADFVEKFVQERLHNGDMRDPHEAFVLQKPAKNFWVVLAGRRKARDQNSHAVDRSYDSAGGANATAIVTEEGGEEAPRKDDPDAVSIEDAELEDACVVGCVGAYVREAEDMERVTPLGKEYLRRGFAGGEPVPLWGPVGARGRTVELVRMAVDPGFRRSVRTPGGSSSAGARCTDGRTATASTAVPSSDGEETGAGARASLGRGGGAAESTQISGYPSGEERQTNINKPPRGVSSLLTEAVARFAVEQGCGWVVLTTSADFERAHRAYRRLGFGESRVGLPSNVAFGARAEDLVERNMD
eukprot:gene386-254_t